MILARFSEPLPLPSQPVSSLLGPPRHEVTPRLVERILSQAAYGLKMIVSKASKKAGKFLLRTCRGNLDGIGHGHRLDALLEEHQFPMDIDSRHSSGDQDPMPDPPSTEDMSNFYLGYFSSPGGRGGDTTIDAGPSVDASTSASADVVFGPGAQSTPGPVSQVTQATQRRHRDYVVGSTTQSKIRKRATRKRRGEPPERLSP